ncbi:MAG: hypothetical protein ACYC9Y_03005 [Candidatus Methylomirabilia bacterium]
MNLFDGLKTRGLVLGVATVLLVAPAAVRGFSIDQQGCAVPPKFSLPPLPELSGGPLVSPEDSVAPWTATFKFHGSGQTTLTWGCFEQGAGTAENVGYAITVEGRYGHGSAEEVVTLAIGKPTGSPQVQPWMGTHTFTTYLQCPDGDPWLNGKPCKATGTATPIPGIHFKGPFPLTRGQVPVAQREQFLYKAFPPKFVAPTEKQQIPNGQLVTVELAKSGPLAAQPVKLVFSTGAWAGATTFKRDMIGSTLTVEGTAFGPGEWKIVAQYANDKSVDGPTRTFIVQGGWGGGPPGGASGVGSAHLPQPGSEQAAPMQMVPPAKMRPPAGTTRSR